MPAYAQYRISEKKCATCSYWGGQREIQLVQYKPMYIKAFAGDSTCLANKERRKRAVDFCLSWRQWEKID
jgi:hypothetical protein